MPISPFQFHKGTIRTLKDRTFDLSVMYFNSIKVQLEHCRSLPISMRASSISIP